ncbi:MAG TPA: glycosyltransferase 87 family protein, partial [Ktedonobacterales bacterium]|nr:glycosyltransferase 87 family protein [Ktedonobacterales bacterium]
LPFILSDLITICLLYVVARRVVGARLALLAVGVYAFLPAMSLDGNVWPQSDGVMTLGILVTALLALRGRAGWAGAVMAATLLIKPQPMVFAPLLLVYLWRWYGRRATMRAGFGLVGTGTLICLPLLLPPHPDILSFVANLRAFMATQPMASPSAYNLWWLLGIQRTAAGAPWLGPLSISLVGLALFTGVLLVAAVCLWRDRSPQTLFVVWAVVGLAAFDLMSGQHERYVYPCVALLLLAGLYQRRYWFLSALISFTMFINHALVILWYPRLNHAVLNFTGARDYFAAHPAYSVAISAINVVALVAALVMMWRRATLDDTHAVSTGTTRRADAERGLLFVMQREFETAGEQAR